MAYQNINVTRGYIAMATDTSKRMDFQYNPESFTDDVSVEYKAIKSPGLAYPLYSYTGGDSRTIDFTLFLDSYENVKKNSQGQNTVQAKIAWLRQLLPKPNSASQFSSPPVCLFSFGGYVKKGLLQNLTVRYTMFDNKLNPIRAEVDVKILVIQ